MIESIGSYNDQLFNYLRFDVSRCVNSKKLVCKSNEYIDNIIANQELNINIYFPYSNVNLTN
jgi:hypothetical protein